MELARSMVTEVGFDSTIGGYRADPWAPGTPGGNWFMRMLKPAAWFKTPAGTVRYAPYGEPTTNYTPVLIAGTLVVGGATLAGLVALGRWLERRGGRKGRRR